MAQNCYIAALKPDGVVGQVVLVEDMDVQDKEERRRKPTEDLIIIYVDLNDPKKVTYIGASLPGSLKDKLIKFLQDNKNVFAWITADMPWIDQELITHKLNISPDRAQMK